MTPHIPPSEESATQRDRQMARMFAALRVGTTTFGVLAGVACYLALDQFTAIGIIPSFLAGLGFALLTRTSALALGRDWLVNTAHRAAERQQESMLPTKKQETGTR